MLGVTGMKHIWFHLASHLRIPGRQLRGSAALAHDGAGAGAAAAEHGGSLAWSGWQAVSTWLPGKWLGRLGGLQDTQIELRGKNMQLALVPISTGQLSAKPFQQPLIGASYTSQSALDEPRRVSQRVAIAAVGSWRAVRHGHSSQGEGWEPADRLG